MTASQTRAPAGQPTGGQFAATARDDAAVTLAHGPVIEFPHGSDDTVTLDQVRRWLTESPGDGPALVEAQLSEDGTTVTVLTTLYDDLLWDPDFTEEELDQHRDVVEKLYEETFNAELDVPDTWETTGVVLRTELPRDLATPEGILDRVWPELAKYRNQADPGTFGSPYIGTELRKRIDAARAAQAA